ncbi:hypothetical protein LCGC14_0459210 [marine sediment metagenome]|uniref:Uncharacterized protein n=1 Tax=marine sediment metagenome TaxID=412755 RepID=A0A0F9SYD1_9ZZZZ
MNDKEMTSRMIGSCTSEMLATYVIIYKTLNMDKEMALLSMKELAIRREQGDDFDYETFIEEEIKKIPKMRNLNLPEMGKSIMSGRENFKEILGKNDS